MIYSWICNLISYDPSGVLQENIIIFCNFVAIILSRNLKPIITRWYFFINIYFYHIFLGLKSKVLCFYKNVPIDTTALTSAPALQIRGLACSARGVTRHQPTSLLKGVSLIRSKRKRGDEVSFIAVQRDGEMDEPQNVALTSWFVPQSLSFAFFKMNMQLMLGFLDLNRRRRGGLWVEEKNSNGVWN